LINVVEEETTNGIRMRFGIGFWNDDHPHEIRRDRVVEPRNDALVDL
jgi:hypothetical protein